MHNISASAKNVNKPWEGCGRYLATHTLGGALSSQIVKVDTHMGQITYLTDNVRTNLWPVWRPDTWE